MAAISPQGWLATLEPRLEAQKLSVQLPSDYYDGKHKLAFATDKFLQTFGRLFHALADNWCEIVVDAAVERLAIEGFRFGDGQEGDDRAWEIWQANGLDSDSIMAHTEAVKCGRAYLLVEPPAGDGLPRIYVEHPSQMIVAHAPGNPRDRLAALKRFCGDDGYLYAYLYLPEGVVKYRTEKPVNGNVQLPAGYADEKWQQIDAQPHEFGAVPVVPLYNNPTMLGGGRSDLLPAIPVQDAINKLVADMIVDSETVAFPQRVVLGWEVPKGSDGRPLKEAELHALRSKVWSFKEPDTKVDQLDGADLSSYVSPIEMLIQHLAAQTRTPPHYLLAKMANLSGDALKAAESGLVAKVRRKMRDFSDGWEDAIRLAFKALGDDAKAGDMGAETLWANPERRADAEVADSLVKMRTLGVPLEILWEQAGYSPRQITRMKKLTGLPNNPPPGATTAQVPPLIGGGNGAPQTTS